MVISSEGTSGDNIPGATLQLQYNAEPARQSVSLTNPFRVRDHLLTSLLSAVSKHVNKLLYLKFRLCE